MTTNITPIEALERIKEFVGKIKPLNSKMVRNEFLDSYLIIEDIATKALAPQECDVSKCSYYYKSGKCGCKHEAGNSLGNSSAINCRDNTNCYYKQLHSQQKTFTVEEIKRILKNLHKKEFYDCGECTECLLAVIEKAVG